MFSYLHDSLQKNLRIDIYKMIDRFLFKRYEYFDKVSSPLLYFLKQIYILHVICVVDTTDIITIRAIGVNVAVYIPLRRNS
jgi:hypothetical protein